MSLPYCHIVLETMQRKVACRPQEDGQSNHDDGTAGWQHDDDHAGVASSAPNAAAAEPTAPGDEQTYRRAEQTFRIAYQA